MAEKTPSMNVTVKHLDAKDVVNSGSVYLLKTDGWQNVMTGIGRKATDKFENSLFYLDNILDMQTLSELCRGDGIAKKIVEIPAQDMLRQGFTVEGDTSHVITKYLKKKGLFPALRKAVKLSRQFGGSLMLLGCADGKKPLGVKVLETPINEDAIEDIGFFRVYDRRQVTWYSTDVQTDPTKENYGKPEFYTIIPNTSGSTMTPAFKVHHSRVILFRGEALPEQEETGNYGWGDSVLQAVYTRVRGFAGAMTATESILDEFIIGVMEISNLQDLISGGQEQALIDRLNQVDMSKHTMNTLLVDKDEKYTRISATVNGIKDILEFFKDVLSAVSGIPQVKLFGEQAQGLGSEAAGNIRLYYDDIADMQDEVLTAPLERIISLLLKAKKFRAANSELKIESSWEVKYNTLWQMSDTDKATAHHTQAKADDLYVKNGTLTPKEVALSRFGNKTYSADTVLLVPEAERDNIVPQTAKPEEKGADDVSGAADNTGSAAD